MAVDQKILSGVMDLDSPNETIIKESHRHSRNIMWRGLSANARPERILGNRLLNNSLLPITGQNLNLGRWYDSVKKRIYFFNYNSLGNHGIYVFNTILQTFQRLVQVGINTSGDILNFTADKFICNIGIIYGDGVQGDILYWLNSQGKPCKINVERALSGGYGVPIQESFLDVSKEPVVDVPIVVYEDDPSVTVNNLRKRLFKFKLRYWFDDLDKSVTSIQSEIPLPFTPFNTAIDTDQTKNARIAIIYSTGPTNVKRVEILGAVSEGNQFSDFFLIEAIDKLKEGVPSNDIAVFNFLNDKAYTNIIVQESNQLFDYVPQSAGAQEILSGDTPVYGDIVEGYPNITDFTNGVSSSNITSSFTPYWNGVYFSIIAASQSGLNGFGSGPIHVIVKGKVTANNHYSFYLTDGTEVAYDAVGGDDISDVIQGLINDAISKGFTVTGTSLVPDLVYFSKTNAVLARKRILTPDQNTPDPVVFGSLNAYDWWSKYDFGLVYFDGKGRTNGVVTTNGFSIQTVGYSEVLTGVNIPYLNGAIYHRPPVWAKYFSWVRTKNLSKSKFIQWVSNRTIKYVSDTVGEDSYAYISLEALNAFKEKNPQSPLSYSFAAGDRIRFIKRFNSNNTTANVYSNKDYEIQAQEINPTVNGVIYEGQYLKILLPLTDASFDFGTSDYFYYFFEVYTPAQPVQNDLNLYYEFGERYLIGDAGLPTRYHQGDFQNQSSSLSDPALYFFIKGDNYLRYRTVPVGTEIVYEIESGSGPDTDAGRITIGCTPISVSQPDTNILVGDSPYNNTIGFNIATNDDRWILKIVTGTFNFNISGTIIIEFLDDRPDDVYEIYLQKNDGTKFPLVLPFPCANRGVFSFNINTSFTLNSGERLFIIGWSVPGFDHTRSFTTTFLTVTRNIFFQSFAIDPNFSDYYPSAVNSNGRPFVIQPDADTVRYPVLYRWGGEFQPNTNINRTNRFYEDNFDEAGRGWGAIVRLRYFDKILRLFQERKVGYTGVNQRFITNADGGVSLITSSELITPKNIQYYVGSFGIGNQPDSLVSDGFRDYFFDPIRQMNCRLSLDGVEPISETFFTQTFCGNIGALYLSQSETYKYGGISRISGVLNVRKDTTREYMCHFMSSEDGLIGQQLVFNEHQKGYTGFYDIDADSLICAENQLYAFSQGQLYIHDNASLYSNFFGEQFYPSITLVFNDQIGIKKEFNAVAYEGNQIWISDIKGDIQTSMINAQTGLQQVSLLRTFDYEIQENIRYADFLRDINSKINPQDALYEGDYLTGTYLVQKLTYKGTDYAWIYAPYITWQISGRNY